MPHSGLKLSVFGAGLTSAYWNGAATYYRGLYKNLHALGYRITYAEPDIYGRQSHRDWTGDPPFAHCPVYHDRRELDECLRQAREADLIVLHSGVGADDDYLAEAVPAAAAAASAGARPLTAFWDVDAPATLAALQTDPAHYLHAALPGFDFVFTYGGGPAVVQRYLRLGARCCYPIYNGLDPDTHFPVAADPGWHADLSFLGHCLPDRQARVERFFFSAAGLAPQRRFLLAGEGWQHHPLPANVQYRGFVAPGEHNRLNCSAGWILNLNRDAMARTGFSPPTRVFEAAGAAAAVVTDEWQGIEMFFEPRREIFIAAGAADLVALLAGTSPEQARQTGARMRARALGEHTYARRARRFDSIVRRQAANPLAA